MSAAEPVRQDNAAPRRRRLPTFFGFLLTIAMVWLGGQFLTQGMSDYFLEFDPGAAVLWRGDSSDALTRFATAQLPAQHWELARRLAIRAIRLAPLNATAITAYGLALDGAGQTDKADQVLSLAGQRSWRDPPTQIWLLKRRLTQGQYAEGLAHLDALLRQEERYPPLPLAIMAAAGLDPKAQGPLAERLSYAPRWRTPFLQFLAGTPRTDFVDEEGALEARLMATSAPPTDEELNFYLSRLLREQRYADAEAAWRKLSPQSAASSALISDGDFEHPPRQTPFDWQLASGIGWTAQVGDAPGDGHGKALSVEYDGVSPVQPLRQYLVLAPGTYRFTGMGFDQGGQDADSMVWRIACDGSGDALGTAKILAGTPGQWRPFSADFTIPPTGCPAQMLLLTTSPGDVHKDIVVWYDNLAIAAVGAPVAPSAQSGGAQPSAH